MGSILEWSCGKGPWKLLVVDDFPSRAMVLDCWIRVVYDQCLTQYRCVLCGCYSDVVESRSQKATDVQFVHPCRKLRRLVPLHPRLRSRVGGGGGIRRVVINLYHETLSLDATSSIAVQRHASSCKAGQIICQKNCVWRHTVESKGKPSG